MDGGINEMGNGEGQRGLGQMSVKQLWYTEAEVLKTVATVAAAMDIFCNTSDILLGHLILFYLKLVLQSSYY